MDGSQSVTRTRYRDESDAGACVDALRAVYETGGYPTNWPADPARWLRPSGILQAWVASIEEVPVAGHVILMRPLPGERSAAANELDLFLDVTDHLEGAQALYRRAGFRLVNTTQADWTTPDGGPVTLHRYTWSRYAFGETLRS